MEQFQPVKLPTLPLNLGLVERLPYTRPLGISISQQSGIQLHGFNKIKTILHGCNILLVTSLKQTGTPTTLLAIQYVMLSTLRQRLVSRNLRNALRQNANYQVPPQTCFG